VRAGHLWPDPRPVVHSLSSRLVPGQRHPDQLHRAAHSVGGPLRRVPRRRGPWTSGRRRGSSRLPKPASVDRPGESSTTLRSPTERRSGSAAPGHSNPCISPLVPGLTIQFLIALSEVAFLGAEDRADREILVHIEPTVVGRRARSKQVVVRGGSRRSPTGGNPPS
jgi:hypothetical protein